MAEATTFYGCKAREKVCSDLVGAGRIMAKSNSVRMQTIPAGAKRECGGSFT